MVRDDWDDARARADRRPAGFTVGWSVSYLSLDDEHGGQHAGTVAGVPLVDSSTAVVWVPVLTSATTRAPLIRWIRHADILEVHPPAPGGSVSAPGPTA